MEFKIDISERAQSGRKKDGISQKQLADDSGLNLRTIQQIEKGETVTRGDSLQSLSKALNISPDQLIDWINNLVKLNSYATTRAGLP